MTPRVLSYRFNTISGRATGRHGQLRFCGGCAGAIGLVVGVVTRCRITSAPTRGTVAKAVARRRARGASGRLLASDIEGRNFRRPKNGVDAIYRENGSVFELPDGPPNGSDTLETASLNDF